MFYGVGRKQTPEAFRKACDKFIYVENLIEEDKTSSENKVLAEIKDSAKEPISKPTEKETAPNIDRTTLNLIYKAVKDNSDESGWANLSVVGQYINMVRPDFDSRNYGRAKLSGLIKMLNLFETKIEGSQMYLKKAKNNKQMNQVC
ncbi:hypothetical protein NLHDIDDJ_01290 [Acinetobacter baumannii]|nr:hypothetical protein NLHDIDDJ_01290 [Acinetobacter baumannii]